MVLTIEQFDGQSPLYMLFNHLIMKRELHYSPLLSSLKGGHNNPSETRVVIQDSSNHNVRTMKVTDAQNGIIEIEFNDIEPEPYRLIRK